jgi:hypothetical protein
VEAIQRRLDGDLVQGPLTHLVVAHYQGQAPLGDFDIGADNILRVGDQTHVASKFRHCSPWIRSEQAIARLPTA